MPRFVTLSVSMAIVLLGSGITETRGAETTARDLKAELPRIPPTSPADALKTFQVKPGVRLEQVAAEPLVNSPVAMTFDEDGRMFVCEMRGYCTSPDERVSSIRLLVDTDEDGRFDQATVYVDKLRWPTSVACWDGGIFVADAPDVWYFKDNDGDGQADVRTKIYTGFGDDNCDGLMNSFNWTLDNRIEIAASSTGGDIARVGEDGKLPKDARPRSIRGRDVAFNPKTLEFETTSGALQYGMSYDDWGHKFVCGNHNPVQLVMYEDRYLNRAPYIVAPSPKVELCEEGASGPVYRTSSIEPWRILRTRMRVAGEVRGPVEGGGSPAGYFTAASGVTIYRGTALPKELYGLAFTGEVSGNLIHRRRLETNGLEFIARRIDDKSEFVTSTDNWFRPAQFAHGPDGALYVADVCRELIETPLAIPDDIKKHLDIRAGIDRGRIYRIVADNFTQPKFRKLGKASTDELVVTLAHPNAWHRQTASRLLYQRQSSRAVPGLVKLAEGGNPLARLHALYALDGLNALDETIVLRALRDENAGVRRHGVRLSERLNGWPDAIRQSLVELADDDDLGVRYQLAFTLGVVPPDAERDAALLKLVRRDGDDKWMRFATLLSMSGDNAEPMLAQLLADTSFRNSDNGKTTLAALAAALGQQGRPIESTLASLGKGNESLSLMLARNYLEAVVRSGRSPRKIAKSDDPQRLASLAAKIVTDSRAIAVDPKKSVTARVRAIGALPLAEFADVRGVLAQLLDQQQPQEVQQAVLETLERFDDPAVASLVLDAWPSLGPRTRVVAGETLMARRATILAVLDAVEKGTFLPRDLDAGRVQWLMHHKDAKIRERAEKLLGQSQPGRRQDVVESYRAALQLSGDVARGRQLFQKTCVACHRLEGVGHEVGPSLTAVKNRGAEFIFLNVLDPSREVNPQYVNYVLVTDDGRSMTGTISNETATTVTLRRAEAATDTVLRSQIEQLQSTGLSLMPEGLEQQFDTQGLADLIAYLLTVY